MLVKSFVASLLAAGCPHEHDYKLALYTCDLDVNQAFYSPENEHVGYGYEAGGKSIGKPQVVINEGTVSLLFEATEVEWLNADIEAKSSMIYNATTGNVIRVENFGRKVGVWAGQFSVEVGNKGEVLTIGGGD